MKVYKDFDADACMEIAKRSGVKQTEKDVAYTKFLAFHNPKKIYVLRNDYCWLLGVTGGKKFRIIGIAIVLEEQRKGIGSILLNKAIEDARRGGYKKVTTRSKSGAEFYARRGFDIVGIKDGDYLMELNL